MKLGRKQANLLAYIARLQSYVAYTQDDKNVAAALAKKGLIEPAGNPHFQNPNLAFTYRALTGSDARYHITAAGREAAREI